MIIPKFFRENYKGNISDVKLISHSTGWIFCTNNPDQITTKDLIVEAVTK